MSLPNSLVTVLAFVAAVTVILPGAVRAQAGNKAAQSVQISGFLTGYTQLYYKNRARYHSLAYQQGVRIFNKFTAVRFVNKSAQAIQEITFELGAYDTGYRAIMGTDGKPVVKDMVASGPFAPGATQTLVNANTVWVIPASNGLLGCIRLTGMRLTYADGSTASVPEAGIDRHFIASLSNDCGVPAGHAALGASADIPGVYPAKWMTAGLPWSELAEQPFVVPSDTQPLCAAGSFLEENCSGESTPNAL